MAIEIDAKYSIESMIENKRREDEIVKKLTEPGFSGLRPLHSTKNQEELELSDFAKVIRPSVNDKLCYARIPIRRRNPVEILTNTPIENDVDLEKRIRSIVSWYRDMMSDYNIVVDFGFQALTDDEMDALEEEIKDNEENADDI